MTKEQIAAAKDKAAVERMKAIAQFSETAGKLPGQIQALINEKAKFGWGAWAGANIYPLMAQSLDLSFARTSEPLHKSIVDVQAHSNLILNLLAAFMKRYPAP